MDIISSAAVVKANLPISPNMPDTVMGIKEAREMKSANSQKKAFKDAMTIAYKGTCRLLSGDYRIMRAEGQKVTEGEVPTMWHASKFWLPENGRGFNMCISALLAQDSGIDEIMERLTRENASPHRLMRDVMEAYDLSAWRYEGAPLPETPWLSGYSGKAKWLAECRDQIGATPLLKALVRGVPAEDVLDCSIEEEKAKWRHAHAASHDIDGVFVGVPDFPRLPESQRPHPMKRIFL